MSKPKAKQVKVAERRVHMGLFDFTVSVVTGKYEDACEFVKWKFEDKDFDAAIWDKGYEPRGKCFYRVGYVPVIWVPRIPQTAREHATFAHECLHAVFHLFEWSATPITRDTEEVMGHSLAHIVANAFPPKNPRK